jgi:pimeloyl-ACP methyl ester carboxylesterase
MESRRNKILVSQFRHRDCTLNYLRKLGYSRFILWGRSMGATAALLYSSHFRPIDVMFMVLDSPFFSFELIAFEIASRHVKAP